MIECYYWYCKNHCKNEPFCDDLDCTASEENMDIFTKFRAIEMGATVISQEKYASLEEDSIFLRELEAAGVDNWIWYGEACEARDRILYPIGEEINGK